MKMEYCCCICRENLAYEKKKKKENVVIKPLVTTKCGHLFHPECLNKVFAKNGNDVWTTKDCPVCKMTLTIATDLIRIFPFANTVDKGGPSVEELIECVQKYKGQVLELRNMLESSFLRNRDAEKAINQLKKENERINEKQKQLIHTKTLDKANIEALSVENFQLKSTVISLSNNLEQMNNALQLSRMNPFGFNGLQGQPPNRFIPPFYPNHLPNGHMRLHNTNEIHEQRMNTISRQHCQRPPNNSTGSVENVHSMSQIFSKTVSLNHLNNRDESEKDYAKKYSNKTSSDSNLSDEDGKVNKVNKLQGSFNGKIDSESHYNFVDDFMDNLLNEDTKSTANYINNNNNNNNPPLSTSDKNSFLESKKPRGQRNVSCADLKTPYQGLKQVYGKYRCEKCQTIWGSSQSYANKTQICRTCNIEIFPYAQCPLAIKKKPLSS